MATNVFWAGNVSGTKVVSIYNNPDGAVGNTAPLLEPTKYLDRIYFDTRFEYLNIVSKVNFVKSFPYIEPYSDGTNAKSKDPTEFPRQGYNIYNITSHGLGYTPAGILIDSNTKEIVGSNMIIQNIENDSLRHIALIADSTNFYIKENFFVRRRALTSLTRSYTLLIFNTTAESP
jgi:hypothetical protein